jgi:DNA-binding GntR family transcriptional regulator
MQQRISMSAHGTSRATQLASKILVLARREGLEPGARLIEQRLADALGVSRGPVRAALKALAVKGLVAGERNCGYVLAKSPLSKPVNVAIAADDGGQTYRRIADDRFEGRLPDVVTEAELMRRYNLRRSHLLRLLERMAGEGWITRLPGYGWRFAETLSTPEAYRKAADFRAVIEPAALSEPNYRLASNTIEKLRRHERYMYDRGLVALTAGEIFQAGCTFHEELISGAGNPFYVDALKRVNAIRRLFAYRTYADHKGMRRHIRVHLKLLDLIDGGQMSGAAKLMGRHLARSPKAD